MWVGFHSNQMLRKISLVCGGHDDNTDDDDGVLIMINAFLHKFT